MFPRVNPGVCADWGYLAYPNATPGSPKSPANWSLYVAGPFPGQYCTKNWAWLGGPAGYSTVPFGDDPHLPPGATLGPPGSPWLKPTTGHASDPVATATGNYVRQERDLQLAGIGVPFQFVRTYNSLDGLGGPLGPGWTHSLNASLRIGNGGDLTLRTHDGAQLLFMKNADGSYTGSPAVRARLEAVTGGYRVTRDDQSRYEFDTGGRLSAVRDRNGRGLTLAYGGDGRLATVTDSAGRVITFTHDASGLLTRVALPDGRNVNYGYTAGRLTSVTDARGRVSTYTYEARGLLATKVDPGGHTVFRNSYGNDARVTEQIDARGNRSTFAWDAATQTSTMTDARSNAWKQMYARNLLVKEIDPLGNTTEYAYDGSLNRTSVKDARGNTTTMTYDARGNLLTRTAPTPLSYQETWSYNSRNDPLTYQDARGNTTSYGYDPAGNLTSITEPGSTVTQIGRDPGGSGLIASITDPRGKTTAFDYDTSGNLTAVTTPLGNRTTMAYDASGRLTSRVEPRGNVQGANPADYRTTFTWDADDNLLTVTDALGNVTTRTYNADGHASGVTDAKNRTTAYAYDASHHLTSVTAPTNAVTAYTYDAVGNLISRTDANNHTTTYGYDAANRLTSRVSPTSQRWTNAYDANGNLTRLVDANGNASSDPNDGTTVYTYDALDRPTAIDYSDTTPDVTFGYDGNGNRTQMNDGAGTQSYGYDALDRLTAVTRDADSFSYAYDTGGNLTQRTYPGGRVSAYTYDDDSRLATVSSNGATTTYSYDAAGNLTQTELPATNGYAETRTYDRAGRLTEVRNARSGSTLSFSAYVRDQVGNPTQITTSEGISTYAYDALDRLTQVCYQVSCPGGGDPFIRWAYDPVGNRTIETRPAGTTSYTYNGADELSARNGLGGVAYAYDANGNQTQAGSRTFAYDLADRLKSTTEGSTITYSYDGDGDRSQTTDGGTTTNYLWDVNHGLPQLAIERNGDGTILRNYLYGQDRVSMNTGGATSYYHHDGIASVINLTSTLGTTQWTYTYEPFGRERVALQSDEAAPPNPFRFTGEQLDGETSFYHLRARQYGSMDGRFLSPDPVQASNYESGTSSYGYVGNRPTVLADPSGLCPMCVIIAAGAVAGAAANTAIYTGKVAVTDDSFSWRGIGAAAASGAVAGSAGTVAGPVGGSIVRAVGGRSSGVAAKAVTAAFAGLGGVAGQATQDLICDEDAAIGDAAIAAVVGAGDVTAGNRIFPITGVNTISQAAIWAPRSIRGLFRSGRNAKAVRRSQATSALVGTAAGAPSCK